MGFNQNKCKTQCQLCAGRIRLMRNKRNIQLKNSRKEVANLLRTGKAENARIRVETVMREEAMLQAYDVVELFVELLQVRVAIVDRSKELPPDMTEAISSLIYAAARVTDLQELAAIKTLLAAKFGKEYATEAASDHLCRKWHVNDNLIRWLSIEAPSPEDKLACLAEIAQEHGVDWTPDAPQGASVRPYLAGDRTTYSDPLTPPVGGWGGNSGGDAPSYGGGHAGGGQRVTSIYDSEGPFGSSQPPPPRRDAASGIDYDNDYNAAGRRQPSADQQPPADGPPPPRSGFTGGFGGGGQHASRLRQQQQGQQQQGQPPPQQQRRQGSGGGEEDGVVSYPKAGSAADGVVGYPRPGSGGGGGGGSGKGVRFDEAAEYAKEQGGPPSDQHRQPQTPLTPGPGGASQPPPGTAGGSQWAPPPSPGGRGYASHLDAVGKWKARKSSDAAPAAAGPSSSGQPPAGDDTWTRRQAAYDAAPGPPPKPAAGPPPPPSAPPAAAPAAAPKQEEAPTGDELDDLQARFMALKQR